MKELASTCAGPPASTPILASTPASTLLEFPILGFCIGNRWTQLSGTQFDKTLILESLVPIPLCRLTWNLRKYEVSLLFVQCFSLSLSCAFGSATSGSTSSQVCQVAGIPRLCLSLSLSSGGTQGEATIQGMQRTNQIANGQFLVCSGGHHKVLSHRCT